MNAPAEQLKGMSMDEFIERYHEAPFELIDGEHVTMAPPLAGHGERNTNVYDEIRFFLRVKPIGKVYFEQPFVLMYTSDWVKGSRVPDIMYFEAKRLTEYKAADPDWEQKPFVLIPDLCIEIVSKNDSFDDVLGKVERYLDDGVKLVWVIDQKQRIVIVYRQGSNQHTTLRVGDTLSGEDVLPGFTLAVADIFA
jgi:Uma2 family endonuclease